MISEKDRNFGNLNNALEILIRDEVLKQTVKIRRDIQEIEGGLTDLEGKFEKSEKSEISTVCGSYDAKKNDSLYEESIVHPVDYPEMLKQSINDFATPLWRRTSWCPERKWVSLNTRTKTFTETSQLSRSTHCVNYAYTPTMIDILAKDWVKVTC